MRIVFKPMGVLLFIILPLLITVTVVILQRRQLLAAQTATTEGAPPPAAPAPPAALPGPGTGTGPDGAPGSPAEGVYRIRAQTSGYYLGIRGGSVKPESEAHIEQQEWANQASAKWRLYRQPDGTYNLQNVGTGLWLDDIDGSLAAGDNVREWYEVNRTTNNAQKWALVPQGGNDVYDIRCAASGKVLGMRNGSKAVHGVVYAEDWAGKPSQKFALQSVPD